MNLVKRVLENLSDVIAFGPQFLGRHVARVARRSTVGVTIPHFGKIQVRVGESDIAAVRQIFRDQTYIADPRSKVGSRIYRRYEAILDAGLTPVIVDAGANIGAASIWFQMKFPRSAVVSIEPEPNNVSILRMNVVGNKQIKVIEAAVGAEDGFVTVIAEGAGWAAKTERSVNGSVPIVTMNSAIRSIPNGSPFIAKIDIEGFESDLFSSNTQWLDEVYAVYIEPHDWMMPGKLTSRTFQREFGKRDFEIFVGSSETITYVRI